MDFFSWRGYERDIERRYTTDEEKRMIDLCEGLDYSPLLNLTRYPGTASDNPDRGIIEYMSEGPNFIDGAVVDFYYDYVGEMKKGFERGRYTLAYSARVFQLDAIKITVNFTEDEEEESNLWMGPSAGNKTVVEASPFIRNVFEYSDGVQHFSGEYHSKIFLNETLLSNFNHTIYRFSECSLVAMNMHYWEQWGGDAGFGFWIYQYVVLDPDLNVLFVCQGRGSGVS